ncbi:MAG: glycoside hydrolase family 30 beta sandwich domain-containing protein [Roseburia sp.]
MEMREVKIITTDEKNEKLWEESEMAAGAVTDCMHLINVYPEVTYQTFHGFGGALTEAAAHVYGLMSSEKKEEIMEACYGATGLGYGIGRIHMNSCDFALGNYTYVEEGDDELKTFDISHDRNEILPMLADAKKVAGNLEFLVSPWSPPAFMKTNGEMNHGGKLKKEYYSAWADYFVKFIKEYRTEGADIRWVTVQNEPMAVQTWDSCVYTSEEERLFVRDYLGPAFEAAGLSDVGIFVWDHNKEEGYQRFKEVVADEKTRNYVAGEALHWYTGDHFEAIELVRKMYPDKEIFFTEGCVEYSRFADSGEVQKAEMYAHDILGNLNAGIHASLDWNLLLDKEGGPNHVGNFCAAPIMCDPAENKVEKRLSYYYIGQFSRYIRKGAVHIGTTKYTDRMEVTGFLNPDGERVVVILNKSEEKLEYTLREAGEGICGQIAPHSIQTLCYK